MLKIGLLVDRPIASKYVYELAKWAQDQKQLEISHLVIHGKQSSWKKLMTLASRYRYYDILGGLTWNILIRIERFLLKHLGGKFGAAVHHDHYEQFDLSEIVKERMIIDPIVSPSGLVYQFSHQDVEAIRSESLDLLIRCGSGIFRGDILSACRFGIVSFHHGDSRINRGGPSGFWECYHRWPQTGFVIQQLTEELDGGRTLFRGSVGTHFLFSANQAEVLTKANVYLKDLLTKIASINAVPTCDDEGLIYYNPLYKQPSFLQITIYCGKILSRLFLKLGRRVLGLHSRWSISLLNGDFEGAALWRSKEISPPPGRFWADPFLWFREGKTYCFVEDYVYKHARGHITVLQIDGSEAMERGIAIKEDFHLSFPFIFEYDGALFMCPETSQVGQIRLYCCKEFPLKWELRSILMEGVSAADSMIFESESRWWLLTNLDRSSTNDHCVELNLYSAAHPLSNAWTAHPRNPVKVDSFGGRNAGIMVRNGKLYRFGQKQGFDLYGEGIMIYEITKLTERDYEERLVQEILPKFRPGLRGIHHMTSNGSLTAFDQVRISLVNR
jgi:hypothetical protein